MNQNKISYFRKREKMTQQELADVLKVTKDYISILERGKQTPSLTLAKQIADLFCTTIDNIFFNTQSNKTFEKQNTA